MLANADELEIELGAVIFADGRLIRSDEDGWLSDLFSECVAEKQACYRQILSYLDSGASVDGGVRPDS